MTNEPEQYPDVHEFRTTCDYCQLLGIAPNAGCVHITGLRGEWRQPPSPGYEIDLCGTRSEGPAHTQDVFVLPEMGEHKGLRVAVWQTQATYRGSKIIAQRISDPTRGVRESITNLQHSNLSPEDMEHGRQALLLIRGGTLHEGAPQ